ncbi:MAG: family 10 glycosylhydrolase [Clostridiales bacterium]|nr:family 10 glycosylhydrolase [Clostridiales bacterium]
MIVVLLFLLSGCTRISDHDASSEVHISSESELGDSSQTLQITSSPASEPSFSAADNSDDISSQTIASVGTSSKAAASKETVSKQTSSQAVSSESSYQQVIPSVGLQTKAIWISQFDLQYALKDNGSQRKKEDFTAMIRTMLQNIQAYGFNTLFVQARPYSDSFYPSEYFPWSAMVTGSYSKTASYDPYQIIVTEARKYGFSIHGWINPLRAMTEQEIQQVDDRYLIKQWYNSAQKRGVNIVSRTEGTDNNKVLRWYYNSSVPEVRRLIADGAKELLQKYNLDGIHIDDYFYYSSSLADVSAMVKEIYDAVKSVNPKAQFGISPEGNIDRDYSIHFADVKRWCREKGFIDYICPQIYYGMEHQTYPFSKVVSEFNSYITEESGVFLLAGMTLGKVNNEDKYAGSGRLEWTQHNDVILRCIRETKKQSHAQGVAVFCYQYLFDRTTGEKIDRTLEEVTNFLPELLR